MYGIYHPVVHVDTYQFLSSAGIDPLISFQVQNSEGFKRMYHLVCNQCDRFIRNRAVGKHLNQYQLIINMINSGVSDMIPPKWTHEKKKRVTMEVEFFYGKKAKNIS